MSTATNPVQAARELHAQLVQDDASLVLFFCAPEYETSGFARTLNELFGPALVVGCTSAGEITPDGYLDNAVTGISFARPTFEAAAVRLGPLKDFELTRCGDVAEALRATLRARLGHPPRHEFAMVLLDGLSQREELVMSCLGGVLSDIPVFGASAGDGLTFEHTSVFVDGAFHTDSGVLLLVGSDVPVRPFRNQHFVSSGKRMVVTGADPARRVVTEINAEPAVAEYARVIGYEVDALTPMVFATHPLVVRLGGAEYVRSIQKANPDGSLTFYCAIDEGLVLTLAEGRDLYSRLEDLFAEIRSEIGEPAAVIGFDCVLRKLECERNQTKHKVARLLQANRVIGFSTFGEQFRSMHVNQTFTGVAIGRAEEPDA
ncbi:nitric oxide-sensing protein NosP [Benzoatithermus flavus]|uniref:Nitric oxide-sensing protein NosP n=1 Tax=Benzoatithermus flavus TaxID=3108223 RepID=A0ABU8XYL9_9PROT